MAEEPYKSSVSNFDSNKGGSDPKKSSKAKDYFNGLGDKLTKSLNAFAGDDLKKLNELASDTASKLKGFSFGGLWDKIKDYAKSFADTGLDMLKDMGSDALTNLQNVATSFAGNLFEDWYNTLKSIIYIPDIGYNWVLKGLYYDLGSDMAYHRSYIRNQALKRDWNYSLEFLDQAYGINYDINTCKEIKIDLNICVRNCCWKNIHYIFKKLYDQYKNVLNEIDLDNRKAKVYGPDIISPDLRAFRNMMATHLRNKRDIERILLSTTKRLIVNSRTYLTKEAMQSFFNDFDLILKPRYFGTSDNKYNHEFTITPSEIEIMMPFFTGHDVSKTDEGLYDIMMAENDALAESASKIADDETGPLIKYRKKALNRQTQNQGAIAKTAIKQGTKGVIDDVRNRYPAANARSKRKVVKYSQWNLGDMMDMGMDLITTTQFISPRNNNIKQLYILMSSKTIYGDDRMVNKAFYERCKLKTMTSFMAAADKGVAIAGTSMIFQNLASVYELADILDSLAYRLTKKLDKYLFNPLINKDYMVALKELGFVSEFQYNVADSDLYYEELSNDKVIEPEPTETTDPSIIHGKVPNKRPPHTSNNTTFLQKIEKLLDDNPDKKEIVVGVMRYCAKIPMVAKGDILREFLIWFYDNMEIKNIPKNVRSTVFAQLIYHIFGKTGFISTTNLNRVFNTSTNESLDANIKIISGIVVLGLVDEALHIKSSDDYYTIISNLFILMAEMLSRKVENYGLSKATFYYDQDYLRSLVKQTFDDEIDYLKSINSKKNRFFSTFYPIKDALTESFEGFDRGGIMGFDEEKDHVQYSNVQTGDWMSSAVTSNGTFFGGSDNTKNNGIRKIDNIENTIVETNIKSGNWTKIVEYVGTTFFIKDNSEVYYWDGNNVTPTNIKDFDNWDAVELSGINKLLFLSKTNNGFKVWQNNDFTTVTNIGGGFKVSYTNYGSYLIYATDNPSGIYLLTNASLDCISESVNVKVNSYSIHTIDSIVTRQETVPSDKDDGETKVMTASDPNSEGSESGSTTITITDYYKDKYYLFGTSEGLLNCRYFCAYTDTLEGYLHNPDGIETFNQYINDNIYVRNIDDENVYLFDITKNDIKKCTLTNNSNFIGSISDYDFFKSEDSIKPSDMGKLVKAYFDSDYLYLYTSSEEKTPINKISLFNSTLNNKYLIINNVKNEDVHSIKFEGVYNNTIKFGRKDKDLLYFNESNYTLSTIFTSDELKVNNWKFIEMNDILFLNNPTAKLGLKYFENGKAKDTNITTGSWNICESPINYLIASTDNSNLGLRISSKNNLLFNEVNGTSIVEHDFSAPSYNSKNKKFYFGMDRHETLMNLDNIKYDIDEFLFTQMSIELQNILLKFSDKRFSGLLYAANKNILESDESDNLNDLTKDVVRLSSALRKQNIRQLEKSHLYTDILSYAEAKKEFDVGNIKDIRGLEIDYINKMIADGLNPGDAIRRYNSEKSVYYIAFEPSKEEIAAGSKPLVDTTSDDFMNADPDTGEVFGNNVEVSK